jgi:hypothetical protein
MDIMYGHKRIGKRESVVFMGDATCQEIALNNPVPLEYYG